MQVWNKIEELGSCPLYNADVEVSKEVVAALAGGCKVIEFTNRGDRAFEVFRELIVHFEKADPSVILGIGSVLDPMTAGLYINLGANFIVGSVTNPEVARLCNRRKIPYFPGCATASEVSQAEELGVEVCKVFPGSELGGPSFVKAITAPTPDQDHVTGERRHPGADRAGRCCVVVVDGLDGAPIPGPGLEAITAQAQKCWPGAPGARPGLCTGSSTGLTSPASGAEVAEYHER